QFRHRRMQREERIQHGRRMRAVAPQRDSPVEGGIIGIADRRDGSEAVERAAQDHRNEARVAALGGAREFRQIGPGGKSGAGQQQGAPRREQRRAALTAIHGHLLWNSGDINSNATACWRVAARVTVNRVSGETAFPKANSTRSRGSIMLPMWDPIRVAISSRSFMPSGAAQAALVSGKPLGPGGDHNGSPSML